MDEYLYGWMSWWLSVEVNEFLGGLIARWMNVEVHLYRVDGCRTADCRVDGCLETPEGPRRCPGRGNTLVFKM